MSEGFSTWLPGIVTAVVGLVAGLWAAITISKDGTAAQDRDTALDDLEERKANAVLLLRELEEQRDMLPEAQYEAERDRIERQAAEALRARQALLDGKPQTSEAERLPDRRDAAARETSPVVGFLASRPQLRGMIWGGAVVGVAALLYALVSREGTPAMTAGMSPAPSSAGVAGSAPAPRKHNPELEAVLDRLRRNPNDMDALVEGGHLLLQRMAVPQARPFIDRALQLDPEHPESLVHYAALLAAEGNMDQGIARLDAVLEKHPDVAEGWFYRGMFGMQNGNQEQMRASFERYLEAAPNGEMAKQAKSLLRGDVPAAADTRKKSEAPPDRNGVWMGKCALCHGTEGRGDGRMGRAMSLPDMQAPAWQADITDARIRRAIRQGVVRTDGGRTRRMSAFRDLTDNQIEELVLLIRSWRDG